VKRIQKPYRGVGFESGGGRRGSRRWWWSRGWGEAAVVGAPKINVKVRSFEV
jgi:hypothetical protein